jgi:D-3-phosphoglycerate dehydrogenase
MFKVLVLNNISLAGLERLPRDRYEVASEIARPDAVLLRSANMHDYEVPPTLKAVARAGAGTNNIPVARLTGRGIPVFNAPGANANAVKELVLTGMLLAARNVCAAWSYARQLDGDDGAIRRQVETGKKQFVGFELPGRTLGVVGLGAIGVQVANVALALGMRVVGYDPEITVGRAWELSSNVHKAASVGDLLAQSDFVTLHVPLVDATRDLLDEKRIALMRDGATLLNFSRDGIVDEAALHAALSEGKLHAYVCDFPTAALKDHPRTIALPHIGASTREAEENCAVMVADQLRAFLEEGNIRNSVNFPEIQMPRNGGYRLALVNANVPNMLGQISTTLARAGLNIIDMLNKSRGDVAYTLSDVESPLSPAVIDELAAIEGVMSVRTL